MRGQLVLDNFSGLSPGVKLQGTIALSANVQHDIKLEYREATGTAYVQLRFQRPSQPKVIVPSTSLCIRSSEA